MTLLAHVNTRLGRVELHHEDGDRFCNRRDYVCAVTGQTRTSEIPIGPQCARERYELAEREGAVYEPFPEVEAVSYG